MQKRHSKTKLIYIKKTIPRIIGVSLIILALYLGYADLFEHEWRYKTLTEQEIKKLSISEIDTLRLYQLMKDTHEILSKHNIEYWIESGTLLGAVRHKGIIPFDDDLDIGIMHYNEIKLQDTIPDFEKLGYEVRNHTHYVICTSRCLDIFIYHNKDGRYLYTNLNVRKKFLNNFFLTDELFPLKKYQFGKLALYGPQKTKEYLDRAYPEWDKYVIIQQPHNYHIRLNGFEKKTKFTLTPALLKHAMPTGPLMDQVNHH